MRDCGCEGRATLCDAERRAVSRHDCYSDGSVGEEVATPVPEEQGHVPQDVFIAETEKLLIEAAGNTEELHRTLEKGCIPLL